MDSGHLMAMKRMLCLRMTKEQAARVRIGEIKYWRQPITSSNSFVRPGKFSNLQMETGHRQGACGGDVEYIRIPCVMASGTRTVSVSPKVRPGSFGWIRTANTGDGSSRAQSAFTLRVLFIRAVRLIDLYPGEAPSMGFTDREQYADYWKSRHGPVIWKRNPWTWEYYFDVVAMNIDDIYRKRHNGESIA